jgi:hypothetical protein
MNSSALGLCHPCVKSLVSAGGYIFKLPAKFNHPRNQVVLKNANYCVKYVYRAKGLLGTLFDPCRLAYLAYTSND